MYFIPDADSLDVPFLGSRYPVCDEANFTTYPQQCRVNISDVTVRTVDLSPEEVNDLAGFLQAWLVLGLMQKILGPSGIAVGPSDFVFPSPSSSVEMLNPTSIDLYLIYWKAKELGTRHMDIERGRILWQQHAEAFAMTRSAVNDLIDWRIGQVRGAAQTASWEPTVLDDVLLSIVLVSEWLFYTGRDLLQWESVDLEWKLDVATRHRLVRAGWCPGEIQFLDNRIMHSTSLYILSCFDRHSPFKVHRDCDDNACTANNIDESTYITRHCLEGCSCAHLGEPGTSSQSITQVLHDGGIPVIHVESHVTDGTDGVRFSTRDSEGVPYVAISHVWSDGLGNPHQNTLPQCQLLRLQDYVNQLYDESLWPVSFWIDTICVPLDRQYRSLAIQRMASTYAGADKVLVLDAWLLQAGLDSMREWNMLKIMASTWAQRVWTLQEAMLPRQHDLFFQSSGGALCEDELFYMTQTEAANQTWRMLMLEMGLGTQSDYLRDTHLSTANMMVRLMRRAVHSLQTTGTYGVDYDDELPLSRTEEWRLYPSLFQELEGWLTKSFVWCEGRNYVSSLRWRTDNAVPDHPITAANIASTVAHNLKNRSISKAEDEAVCLATILRQDIKDLLAEPSAETRMKMVFSRLKHISAASLFTHAPRIDEPGFRWAPATLLSGSKMYQPGRTFTRPGQVRPDGLLVTLDGLLLTLELEACTDINDFFIEVDSHALRANMNGERVYGAAEAGSSRGLIISQSLEDLQNVNSAAVMVEIKRREEDVLFVNLLAHYFVSSHKPEESEVIKGVGAQLAKQQQWCVG